VCGIAGIIRFDGKEIDHSELYTMPLSMRHRGSDDEGAVLLETSSGRSELRGGPDTPAELTLPEIRLPAIVKTDVALGNRRLAIIDLSQGTPALACLYLLKWNLQARQT
jgi:asparagine synthetase B (glutamine-hydrolysing)